MHEGPQPNALQKLPTTPAPSPPMTRPLGRTDNHTDGNDSSDSSASSASLSYPTTPTTGITAADPPYLTAAVVSPIKPRWHRIEDLFSHYKLLDLLALYFVLFALNSAFMPSTSSHLSNPPPRIEHFLFCLLSLATYARAYRTSARVLVAFTLFMAVLDISVYYLTAATIAGGRWTAHAGDAFVYLYMISLVRGWGDIVSWGVWIAFVVVDVWARPPPPRISSGEVVTQERRGDVWTTWMATHAISYGIYVANAEFVAWVMKRKGRGEDTQQGLEPGDSVGVETGKTRGGQREKARHTKGSPREDEQAMDGEAPPSDMSSSSSSYSSLSSIPVSSSSDLDHPVAHHYHYLPRRSAVPLPTTADSPLIDLCVTDISSCTATFFWTITFPASTSSSSSTSSSASSSSSSSSDESSSSAHRPRRSRREDVLIYVDSLPWSQDNLCEAVAGADERGIVVRGLRPATEYAVEVMIRTRGKGWRCGRVRVCTAAAGRGDHHNGPAAFLPSQSSITIPDEPISSTSTMTTPPSTTDPPPDQLYHHLHSALDHERQLKKDGLTSLKKLRRDLARSESQLRAESDSLRRSFSRHPANVAEHQRLVTRVAQLEEQVSRLQLDTTAFTAQAATAHSMQVEQQGRLDVLLKTHAALRLQHKRAERGAARTQQQQRTAAAELEARFLALAKERDEIVAQAARVERMDGPNIAARMVDVEKAVGVERAKATRLERRRDEVRREGERQEAEGREEEDRVQLGIERLEGKNKQLRGTKEAETRFGEALKKELDNFRREAVEGYFEYRGRGVPTGLGIGIDGVGGEGIGFGVGLGVEGEAVGRRRLSDVGGRDAGGAGVGERSASLAR